MKPEPERHYSGIEIESNSELGRVVSFICPGCGEKIKQVERKAHYTMLRCACDKLWSFHIFAESRQDE